MKWDQALSVILKETLDRNLVIQQFTPVGGGCISNGGRLSTSSGEFFVKWNDTDRYPEMFQTEASGLRLLAKATPLKIPSVINVSERDGMQFIIMEYVGSARRNYSYWLTLASGLCALHKNTSKQFGLDFDNYIGSLPQPNTSHEKWSAFFVEERLRPQLYLLEKSNSVDLDTLKKYDSLFLVLEDFFPDEPPSLIHGDLWSGNLITDSKGDPCLIDPAVYFGHREAELAFTMLFGGFERPFYDSYSELYPIEKDFEKRVDLYNLYPLLVHANLFGSNYFRQAQAIVDRYV